MHWFIIIVLFIFDMMIYSLLFIHSDVLEVIKKWSWILILVSKEYNYDVLLQFWGKTHVVHRDMLTRVLLRYVMDVNQSQFSKAVLTFSVYSTVLCVLRVNFSNTSYKNKNIYPYPFALNNETFKRVAVWLELFSLIKFNMLHYWVEMLVAKEKKKVSIKDKIYFFVLILKKYKFTSCFNAFHLFISIVYIHTPWADCVLKSPLFSPLVSRSVCRRNLVLSVTCVAVSQCFIKLKYNV